MRMPDVRSWPRRGLVLWGSPLGKVLAGTAVLRLAGLAWGLPASDGWDDDGVAPRDFLVGVMETYWPGHHYTYPPLHLLILTVVNAPVWLTTILRAPSYEPAAVVHWFIGVPTMTALAVISRLVTMGLSLGLLWNLAEIGKLLRGAQGRDLRARERMGEGDRPAGASEPEAGEREGRRAAAWVAAACALNAVLTYYSQTTNLDVPYLFWSFLSLRWLVHAVVDRAPRSLRRVLLFAALAVATKDQAYALFLFGVPLSLAGWLLIDRGARPLGPRLAKELATGSAIALPLLLFIDGAVTNPLGWRERVRYLLGSASQDFAFYPPTWTGRLDAARDALLSFGQFYPWAFAVLAVAGLVVAWRGGSAGNGAPPADGGQAGAPGTAAPSTGARRAAGLVPLFAALSFTLAFDMSARRSEHRFALPQMIAFGIYAGLALDEAHARLWPRRRWALYALGAPLAFALFKCIAVDAAMLLDPRYDAEAWMRENVRPGDRMEIYGSNVQLPRLPSDAVIERVDVGPVGSRNPILGVTEVQTRFADIEARRPRFIVVPEFWIGRYLIEADWVQSSGRVLSPGQERLEGDLGSRAYFHALRDGHLRYRMAHISTWTSQFWPRVDIHASLTRELWIFERVP
jgi:hypothetical protein